MTYLGGRSHSSQAAVRRAGPDERDRVNAFYASEARSVRVEEGERWIVAELLGRVIGVLRICFERGHQVLRTVQVTESLRGRGIGTRLLDCAEQAVDDTPCFCLPFSHLERFYGRIGFAPIPIEEAPEHLQQRLRSYLAQRRDMIVMRRPSGPGRAALGFLRGSRTSRIGGTGREMTSTPRHPC